jgi:hypothetical protein
MDEGAKDDLTECRSSSAGGLLLQKRELAWPGTNVIKLVSL